MFLPLLHRLLSARTWVLACVMVGHVLISVGYPVNVAVVTDAGIPYPCASRACGCRSSAECWQGDCCCFTLAEKVAWAEKQHVALPDDVYVHLAELNGTKKPKQHATSCCATKKAHSCGEDDSVCCKTKKPTPCCEADATNFCENTEGDCPHCVKKETQSTIQLKWVLEIAARKCRGQGPTGLYFIEPAIVPTDDGTASANALCVDMLHITSQTALTICYSPPTPPPRFC